MINFFRKIRQKMADDNKPLKYMRYAIGEIVLVVIGILIALQINNWNEQRKSKEDEIATLQNFSENLQNDLLWFNLSSKYIDKAKNSMALLLSWMEEDLPYRDSLKYHFGNANNLITPSINTSPFESLKSKNLNLISNKDLRQQIILFYDAENTTTVNTIKEYRTIVLDASVQLYNTRFDAFWNAKEINPLSDTIQYKNDQSGRILQGEMVPIDFEKLKKDQEYLYFLKSLKNRHYYLMEDMVDNQTANIKALISEIDAEIVLLKNR